MHGIDFNYLLECYFSPVLPDMTIRDIRFQTLKIIASTIGLICFITLLMLLFEKGNEK